MVKIGFAGSHVEDNSYDEYYYSGGGYFSGPDGIDTKNINRAEKCLGGFLGIGNNDTLSSSNGGIGGSGGKVILSGTTKVFAYNGNKYTDSSQEEPLIINSQSGINIEKYSYKKVEGKAFTLSRKSKKKKVKKIDYGQGIGAGAGYIEGNNGKFRDDTKNE